MTEPDTDLDTAALEPYLSEALDAPEVGTEVVHDGLNLTVAISVGGGEPAYVLRRPNKLRHTELFNDLRGEFGVLRRLRTTAIEAPEPVLYCEDESILGDEFFVMTRLDGDPIPMGSPPPERFRNPDSRARLADLLINRLAAIHDLDVDQFEDVCDRHTALDQVEHATDRLDRATSVTGRDVPGLRTVAEWLRRNAPSESTTTLVHGDYRPANVLFAGTDRPDIGGVIDWETAMLGDPLTELGYLLLRWRDDGDPTPSLDRFDGRYSDPDAVRRLERINEAGFCPFTNRPGSPTRRELVARYEDRTGIAFEDDRFYRAHAALLLATVWEDLHRYRVEADEPSDFPPLVDYMSAVATDIIDGEFDL